MWESVYTIKRKVGLVMPTMVDFAAPLSASNLQQLDSVDIFGRYLNTGWKGLTVAEVQLIESHGKQIVSVYENNPTSVSYFTTQQAVHDAQDAVNLALALGQSIFTVIYFAVDYDVQLSDYAAIRNYFNVLSQHIAPYRVGIYGGNNILSAIGLADEWQTCAWSTGIKVDKAHIYQRLVDTTLYGVHVDVDDVNSDPGAWPVQYPPKFVEVNSKPFPAIVVNGTTFVLYTALDVYKTPYHLILQQGLYHGLMDIDGEQVWCVVYNGSSYVPWNTLAKGIQSVPINTWDFIK